MIFIVGLILLLSNPIDAQARKKRKASKKKTVQVIKPAKKFFHEEGHFTIAFPGTHGQVKGDTSLIARTVQRKVKMVREGLYHSRISYFTVKGEGDKTVYFRCENIINAPRVYQLLYQTSVKSGPDSPEAKKFFQSFSLKVKR